MSQELVYTSVPRGLAPGSQGFCTVACTRGMSTNLMQQLESLSGYRQLYSTQDPNAALNPVAFSHLLLTVAGRRCHVLSRIGDAGADYTGRSNKFAHHVVLDAAELPAGGPAWLLARDGFMRSQWNAEPCLLPTGPVIPSGDSPPRICRAWQQLTGDAGWAGVLAETAAKAPGRQAVLVYRPGTNMLALLAEALCLLPKELRWGVSLCTYFTKLPTGVSCQWRCVADGTPEAAAARRGMPATLVLDLCQPLGQAAGGPLVEAARTGKMPAAAAPSALPPGASPGIEGIGAGYQLAPFQSEAEGGEGAGLPFGLSSGAPVANYPSAPPPVAPFAPPPYRRFKPKPRRWPWMLAIAGSILLLLVGGVMGWIAATWRQPAEEPAQVANAVPKDEPKKPAAKKPEGPPAETAPAPTSKAETPNKSALPPEPQNIPKKSPAQAQSKVEVKALVDSKEPQPPKPPDQAPKPDAVDKPQQESPPKIKQTPEAKTAKKKPAIKEKNLAKEKTAGEKSEASPPAFQLPEFTADLSGKIPTRITLGEIGNIAQESQRVDLGLISNDVFSGGFRVRLVETGGGWECLLKQETVGERPIADFRIDGGKLGFTWRDCSPEIVHVVNLLQNCLLEVRSANPKKSVVIPLRAPVSRRPVLFNDLTDANQFRAMSPGKKDGPKVCFLPAVSKIELKNVEVKGLSKSDITIDPTPKQPNRFLISVGVDLPLHFEVSLDPKDKDCRITLKYDRVEGWDKVNPATNKHNPTLDDINRELEGKKAKKNSLSDSNAHETKKDEIDKIEREISRLGKLKAISEKLWNSGELHYCISMMIGDHEITLLETSQTDPPK